MDTSNVFAPGQPVNYQIPNRPKDWFSYPVTFTSMTNNVAASTNIQIDAASDFFLTAIEFSARLAASTTALTAATRIIPGVALLLTDGGSSRQLSQGAVQLESVGGDGSWPHRLLMPRLFVRNSLITVQITPNDASLSTAWDTLRINFEGFRIYN